ncbi:MAG: tRNA threonylcarbamoyl adenosine modification protein YjeE [Acidimicrobiaceae bacterium]|nr:tRNA threonylcarbamoyl adenosine modification protein YjeE [Acidimicrobiaceae bacterium]
MVTRSAAETGALGALVAGLVAPGDVLLLSGGLGAGKTTLTKGIVGALGSDEQVTSPTFTLLRTYDTEPVVAHVDCWRLELLDEVADLAIDEVLDEGGVAVVEWGEAAAPLIGRDALEVLIGPLEGDPTADSARLVRFSAASASWQQRVARLGVSARGSGMEVR